MECLTTISRHPLVRAAQRLAEDDPELARTVYLEALGTELSAGRGVGNPHAVAVARAAAGAPPAAGQPRPPDLLLEGLVVRLTQGFAAAAPGLTRAARAVIQAGSTIENGRWLWLAARVADDLWDDRAWHLRAAGGDEGLIGSFPEHPGHHSSRRDAAVYYERALRCNARGEYDSATAAAQQACASDDVGLHGWALSELVVAASRTSQLDVARAALAQLTERALASGTEWALGILARGRALLSPADAEEYYQESIARLGRADMGLDLGRTHLLYGEWLRRENRRVHARDELHRALDSFETTGAAAFSDRVHSELLATGETVRKRTVSSYAELTPQEERIAHLAGSWLTNAEIATRLFLSPRTVEWHLGKVFAKLGVASRRELSQLQRRHRALAS
ncbi:MAG: helix-turn-helix transcriptional regulator [Nocardioides sp.]